MRDHIVFRKLPEDYNLEQAHTYLRALAKDFPYHLDDGPHGQYEIKTNLRTFSDEEADVIEANIDMLTDELWTWDDIWEIYYHYVKEAGHV